MGVATPTAAAERRPARAPLRPAHSSAAASVALAVAATTLLRLSLSPWSGVAAAAAALLVWVAAIDVESRLLPDKLVLPGVLLLLAAGGAVEPDHALERLVAALAAFAFLLVAVLARPGSLGMGDAKLALLLGALLGRDVLAALVVGFSAVGLVGLVLVAARGKSALKMHLPFGPFLAFGAILILLARG